MNVWLIETYTADELWQYFGHRPTKAEADTVREDLERHSHVARVRKATEEDREWLRAN